MRRSGTLDKLFVLASLLGSASRGLAGERPAIPSDLAVTASIERAAAPAGACLVRTEVRETKLNRVLASLPITLAAGEQGALLTLAGERRIHIDVNPVPGCGGGAYSVVVSANGMAKREAQGQLEPVLK